MPKLTHFLLCCVLIFMIGSLVAPALLQAETATETKIRLMADALRARDAGRLTKAKENLEELVRLAPDDPTVQRLLDEVNAQLAPSAGPFVAAPGTPPARPAAPPETAAPVSAASFSPDFAAEAEAIARKENLRQMQALAAAEADLGGARGLARVGRFAEALAMIDRSLAELPENPRTVDLLSEMRAERASILTAEANYRAPQSVVANRPAPNAYTQVPAAAAPPPAPAPSERVAPFKLSLGLGRNQPTPGDPDAGPDEAFYNLQDDLKKSLAKGRAQYLAGDLNGAQATFREAEVKDPDNAVAKGFLQRIAEDKADIGVLNRGKTRAQLLEEVAKAWQRPGIYDERAEADAAAAAETTPLAQKLATIQVPNISFNRVALSSVVSALGAISEDYDTAGGGARGVNVVLIDPTRADPLVSITLRNLSLKRILDFITDSVGYQYEIQADAIVVRPGGEISTLDTDFFPVTRSTVIRMTGLSSPASTPANNDPFSAPSSNATGGGAGGGESTSIRLFLQQAGVDFDGVAGSSLAYDGSAMIVTQTTRNIERIRNILNRYNDVRQVEIEAKFMEVQEGALEELGVSWAAARREGTSNRMTTEQYQTQPRSLSDTFTNSIGGTAGRIIVSPVTQTVQSTTTSSNGSVRDTTTTTELPGADISTTNNPPSIPGGVDLASAAGALGLLTGVLGDFDVTAVIRALSRQSGTDLLSAPKVTVLSGNPATMTVAQELRYPQSYGEIQSSVGSGGLTSSSAGVAITAGTPQDFTTRNVGVELRVTPTVEEDDYSISLDLNPRVTEFEGFVEYGGASVAVTNTTTVTVPSGFYQPIFSTREVSTKVTIWDGATLVMGGLTREEVKKVNDKVPFLGSIPFIGRAFQSKGESTTKRNLLIFVTANLVSPGGSPKKQNLQNTRPSSMFQNPTIVTPASSESRVER